jgi:hypothetical protein
MIKHAQRSNTKTPKACATLLGYTLHGDLCWILHASVASSRVLFLLLLHHLLTNSVLSFTNTQWAISSEVVSTASEHMAAGAPDLLVVELGGIEKFRVATEKSSCWLRVRDTRCRFVSSKGRDGNFFDAVSVLLGIQSSEIMDARTARETRLRRSVSLHVGGCTGGVRVTSCRLRSSVAHFRCCESVNPCVDYQHFAVPGGYC